MSLEHHIACAGDFISHVLHESQEDLSGRRFLVVAEVGERKSTSDISNASDGVLPRVLTTSGTT